jgi:hypothetical protein
VLARTDGEVGEIGHEGCRLGRGLLGVVSRRDEIAEIGHEVGRRELLDDEGRVVVREIDRRGDEVGRGRGGS